jgi:acyl-CoA reductase-like NAD-dependent aldehyde dehydrogenase
VDKGFWIEPTILVGVRPGMKVHDEEIFSPVLSVVGLAGEGEVLRMVKALDVGIIWVNTMLTGYPQIPAPPHKMSGTGVEPGTGGLSAYHKRKSALLGYDIAAPVGWEL